MHALQLLNRALRHQNHVAAQLSFHAHLAELPGQQGVLRIGEAGLQFERAGLRVHLVERVFDAPLLGKFGVVGQDQRERRIAEAFGFFLNERYCDSVTLNRTQIGSSGTMVVSGCGAFAVTSPPTGTSVSPIRPLMGARMVAYSRFSAAVRRAARCASTFPPVEEICVCGRSRVWSTFAWLALTVASPACKAATAASSSCLRGGVFFHQRRQAIVVLLGLHQIGLRGGQVGLGLQQRHLLAREFEIRFALRQISFGLLHRGLVRAQIQNVQHVAGVHFLAGVEKPLVDIAVHAAAHLDRVAGVGLRRILGHHRHVGCLHLCHHHARAAEARGTLVLGRGIAAGCDDATPIAKNKTSFE